MIKSTLLARVKYNIDNESRTTMEHFDHKSEYLIHKVSDKTIPMILTKGFCELWGKRIDQVVSFYHWMMMMKLVEILKQCSFETVFRKSLV